MITLVKMYTCAESSSLNQTSVLCFLTMNTWEQILQSQPTASGGQIPYPLELAPGILPLEMVTGAIRVPAMDLSIKLPRHAQTKTEPLPPVAQHLQQKLVLRLALLVLIMETSAALVRFVLHCNLLFTRSHNIFTYL